MAYTEMKGGDVTLTQEAIDLIEQRKALKDALDLLDQEVNVIKTEMLGHMTEMNVKAKSFTGTNGQVLSFSYSTPKDKKVLDETAMKSDENYDKYCAFVDKYTKLVPRKPVVSVRVTAPEPEEEMDEGLLMYDNI